MPEGDTIFRAARTLHRALAGQVVTRFETQYAQIARVHDDAPITGRTVEKVESRGKHLLMYFSGGHRDPGTGYGAVGLENETRESGAGNRESRQRAAAARRATARRRRPPGAADAHADVGVVAHLPCRRVLATFGGVGAGGGRHGGVRGRRIRGAGRGVRAGECARGGRGHRQARAGRAVAGLRCRRGDRPVGRKRPADRRRSTPRAARRRRHRQRLQERVAVPGAASGRSCRPRTSPRRNGPA